MISFSANSPHPVSSIDRLTKIAGPSSCLSSTIVSVEGVVLVILAGTIRSLATGVNVYLIAVIGLSCEYGYHLISLLTVVANYLVYIQFNGDLVLYSSGYGYLISPQAFLLNFPLSSSPITLLHPVVPILAKTIDLVFSIFLQVHLHPTAQIVLYWAGIGQY